MTDPHTLPAPFDGLHLHKGWFPGVIGWVASEHGRYYAKHWGLGAVFEAKVAGALAELVQDGITGLLFEPDNAQDLADKMRWAHQHPDEMATMGRNARRQYEAEYTAEHNYQHLMAIYADAIATVKAKAP